MWAVVDLKKTSLGLPERQKAQRGARTRDNQIDCIVKVSALSCQNECEGAGPCETHDAGRG